MNDLSPSENRLPVYVINLDSEPDRLGPFLVMARESPNLDVHRVRGVPGGTLPQNVCDFLTITDNYNVGRGALGVFLSHAAAWEAVANQKSDFALIIEDDAHIEHPDLLSSIVIPTNVDIVFCNEELSHQTQLANSFEFLEISTALTVLHTSKSRRVGADGYFLTRRGADKLITAIKTDRYFGHVDWRLLRYSVTLDLIRSTVPDTELAFVIENHHCWSRPQWGVLEGRVLSPAVVKHRYKSSNRVQEDKTPLSIPLASNQHK